MRRIRGLSSWYTVAVDLTTQTNFNLYTFLQTRGWSNTSKKLRAFINIPSGVSIYSTDPTLPSFVIPNSFRSYDMIQITNNGSILGAGGLAGAGGGSTSNGSSGGTGGTALHIQNTICNSLKIINNGNIYSGGGGGGGGAGHYSSYSCNCSTGCFGSTNCCCTDSNNTDGCPPAFPGDPCYNSCLYGTCTGPRTTSCSTCTDSGTGGSGGSGKGHNISVLTGLAGTGTGSGSGGSGGNYGSNGNSGGSSTTRTGGLGGLTGYYLQRSASALYNLSGSGNLSGRLL